MTVPTDDTGRMDDQADSSPATETTQPQGIDGEVEAATSAETENTDTAPQEHMIPKSRLDEVLGAKRDLQSQLETAQAKLAELERVAEPAPADASADEPPPGLNERERARWLITHDAIEALEKKVGMTVDQMKTALATTQTTSRDYAARVWKSECEKHSMDPNSREVQEMVGGLVKVGVKQEEAFKRAAKVYATAAPSQATPTAKVEETSVNPALATAAVMPRGKQQAVEMARKGQKAPFVSSQDLIKQGIARHNEKFAGKSRYRSIS